MLINIIYFIILNIKLNRLIFSSRYNYENLLKVKEIISEIFPFVKFDNYYQEYYNDKNEGEIFNEKMNLEYIDNQKNFCKNNNESNFQFIEKNIKIIPADLYDINFNMFIYKDKDVVSSFISRVKSWDPTGILNILNSLNFYAKKKNLEKSDIFILDIGANVGWYSLYLGKVGYKIMAFEPSKVNYYIFQKNYCLNQEINVTIINKGLYNEEKNCNLYHHVSNIGNAYLFCDKKKPPKGFFFQGKIKLTKLKNYIQYLTGNNLAFIKIDIEGAEGKAFESGIELIIKYHIPFIHLEFSPKLLKAHNTDPKLFLKMFENNGYKFSIIDFFNKNYSSIDDLLKKRQINIYIVYIKFIEK